MVTREEYERIITKFLVELNHRCLDISEQQLRSLPRFNSEIEHYVAELRDPANDAAQLLRQAFAYVDEYLGADWAQVMKAGYEAQLAAERNEERRS
jgi:hypothetical protein